MSSKLKVTSGILFPIRLGNPLAHDEGATVVHDPWTQGLAGYLVQGLASELLFDVSSGKTVTVSAGKVVVVSDLDPADSGPLLAAASPKCLFFNGEIYFGSAGTDLRWTRVIDQNGTEIESSRMNFAVVVHTRKPVGYTSKLVDGRHSIEIELPSTGLVLYELEGTDEITTALGDDVVLTLKALEAGGGATTDDGGDNQDGAPWPPK